MTEGQVTKLFSSAGFFVLRTPLLPFEEFLRWGNDLRAAPALNSDEENFKKSFTSDCAQLRDRLQTAIAPALTREALFIASPNIIERFHLWLNDPESERGRKMEHVLVRYFSRMTSRATPFGLFAGCSVGRLGDETRFVLEDRKSYQRHTRLDMDYLFGLTEALSREPELRQIFTYYPNSSLYRAAARVRYVESRLINKVRSFHLVAVEDSEYLDETLARARNGAMFNQLARALVDKEVDLQEANDYITELIESQVLVPDILLPVTGPEPIHLLIDQLRQHEQTKTFGNKLDAVRGGLTAIDNAGPGAAPDSYRSIATLLEDLPGKVELTRLFQVDMFKPAAQVTLSKAIIEEILRGVDILHGVAPRRRPDQMSRFREAFVARYENREMSLVDVLDEEMGIGLGTSEETSPLLKDIDIPVAPEDVSTNPIRESMLLRKFSEALQSNAQEIRFDAKELEKISLTDPAPMPDCFAVEAVLAAASESDLLAGKFRLFVHGAFGPSGATLMGRFCHADPELYDCVLSHLGAEEMLKPDAIFAEIVHLPEGRLGNVILRPLLREYEIPYLGQSGAPTEKQLPITDLRVSVKGDRVHLRSATLGREIIPRMTNAHNFSWQSLGIYRFLCLLQYDGTDSAPSWDWGVLSSAPFLPRVCTDRLVLCLARWRVFKDELTALSAKSGAARFLAVQDWRLCRQLPRMLALVDADNVLPVDLDNPLSVESFVQCVKDREEATLQEIFPGHDELFAKGPEGHFVHEMIVPFIRTKDEIVKRQTSATPRMGDPETKRPAAETDAIDASVDALPRRFPPGSEWLYVKLYTGTATADAVLRDVTGPLTESLIESGDIDRWFFIRYGDPEWHLRLRFHGLPETLLAKVMPSIHSTFNPLLDDGRLWRMQLDTYEREIERYGGAEGIVLAERLFHADSESALEIIDMLEPGDSGADERWRLTFYGIDLLLSDFGFDVKGKYEVLEVIRKAFAKEFRIVKSFLGPLSEKFRKERRSLETLLDSSNKENHPLAPGFRVLEQRSTKQAAIVAELKQCERAGRLTLPISELVGSFIHMHANRLLRSAHRQQEMVIYDLLSRVYESQLKRKAPP